MFDFLPYFDFKAEKFNDKHLALLVLFAGPHHVGSFLGVQFDNQSECSLDLLLVRSAVVKSFKYS